MKSRVRTRYCPGPKSSKADPIVLIGRANTRGSSNSGVVKNVMRLKTDRRVFGRFKTAFRWFSWASRSIPTNCPLVYQQQGFRFYLRVGYLEGMTCPGGRATGAGMKYWLLPLTRSGTGCSRSARIRGPCQELLSEKVGAAYHGLHPTQVSMDIKSVGGPHHKEYLKALTSHDVLNDGVNRCSLVRFLSHDRRMSKVPTISHVSTAS